MRPVTLTERLIAHEVPSVAAPPAVNDWRVGVARRSKSIDTLAAMM